MQALHSPPDRPDLLDRLDRIAQARQSVLVERQAMPAPVEPWIERSWRRCLALGYRPQDHLSFASVSQQAQRRTLDDNQGLVQAAAPVMAHMAQAMAMTGYFALLTDRQGVVVHTGGPIDSTDARVANIARVGVDLSEAAVGTTAIGTALAELQPVWLHRGEHFFADTAVYSCAGAPLWGPQGQCIGMLDLTGVERPERPELKHLVEQSARSIENALLLQQPRALLLRLNWPGRELDSAADGLLTLDADGQVTGSNAVARHLIHLPVTRLAAPPHCSELFALPWQMLFDCARRGGPPMEAPLWSGLRVLVLPQLPQDAPALSDRTLRVAEAEMIRRTLAQTRGNVTEAARILGISRATLYRRLGQPART